MMRRMSLVTVVILVLGVVGAGPVEEPPWKRVLQGNDAKKAKELEKQIDEHNEAGRYAEAIPICEALVALRTRGQGENHWQAKDTARWVEWFRGMARLPEEKRAHVREAARLSNQAEELNDQGKYREAEPLYRKALALREATLDPLHPDTALAYNNLASCLKDQGKYAEAEALHRKAVNLRETIFGPHHLHTATSYNNLALTLEHLDYSTETETFYRKALTVFEELLGPAHFNTLIGLNNLASNLGEQGRVAEAEPLLRRALVLLEETPQSSRHLIAGVTNNLAGNLGSQGKHQEAAPLLRRAVQLWEAELGPRHPTTAVGYHNLSGHLTRQGQNAEAEELQRKALTIFEQTVGLRHVWTTGSLRGLGHILTEQGKLAEAEALFRKALTRHEEAANSPSQDMANCLNDVALILLERDKPDEAEPLFRRALALREKSLSARHPFLGDGQNNLAFCLNAQGKHGEAETLFRAAAQRTETLYGSRHPDSARTFNNLASNLDAQGKPGEAEPYWRAAAAAQEALRLRRASTGFDRAAGETISPHRGLARCLASQGKAAEAWSAAERGLAQGLLDDLTSRAEDSDPESRRRQGQRNARLEQIDTRLVPLRIAASLNEANRARHDALTRERDTLTAEADKEATERAARDVYPLGHIQQALAPDMALVVWLDVIDSETKAVPYGCVVRRSGLPAVAALKGTGPNGAWTRDDQALPSRLRTALARHAPDVTDLARRLAAQRLDPLMPHLDGIRRLVVVPVGRMTGVPIEALTERYAVSYAPSATILTRLLEGRPARREPSLLALGDPVFDAPGGRDKTARNAPWKPLPGTRREIEALQRLLPSDKTEVLLGSDASEQRLDALAAEGRLKTFRLLHFATHGDIDRGSSTRSALILARDRLPDALTQVRKGNPVYNGRLTVEAISRWKLDADLVTLSACESGRGKSAAGDGQLGFAHRFLTAGARALVLSQWKVDDDATALLMTRFYENLLGQRDGLSGPLPKGVALRAAQQWLRTLPRAEAEALSGQLRTGALRGTNTPLKPLAKPAEKAERPYAHPYYWAAFTLLGDPE